jgi:uncharacterized surface anchored protein
MNRRTNEISDGYQSHNSTQIFDFSKEATMIDLKLKLIISLAILPIIIIVNSSPSLASIGSTKTAKSNHDIGQEKLLEFASKNNEVIYLNRSNFAQEIRSFNQMKINQGNVIKAEAKSTNKFWLLDHLLTAARNEKTRECRISGICS